MQALRYYITNSWIFTLLIPAIGVASALIAQFIFHQTNDWGGGVIPALLLWEGIVAITYLTRDKKSSPFPNDKYNKSSGND